ncbi:polycomb-like protein [Phytophthora infestans T30-4]|uniref:Polycomb-like protein n=1 Tax=Phytophthora infestans (strain T30-4) TaxID=403677 RepID=D0NJ77_PHYIT|nr:polycomb-like protein [Phytophthora infestans T30-4]EEY59595.1 polycomb-like protein [Phytophthora infestans T30-4]|eukprot:XP_002900788.1 polycomb-like protein [Phytophthora infestans T30-4]
MPSPPSSVIVVDDSSDEEPAPASGRQSAPLLVSSSDESKTSRSSLPKKARVSSPKVSHSSTVASSPKVMSSTHNSESEEEQPSSNDQDEDDTSDQSASLNDKKEKNSTAGHFNGTTDSDNDTSGETTQLRFADTDGRMFADAMSFSELQAQQREFERLQTMAHRKSAPRNTTRRPTTGTKRKASEAASKKNSSPVSRTKSSVLKKTASPSPFDFDFPGSSDDSSESSSSTDENRAGFLSPRSKSMSLKDVVAQERELARLRDEKSKKKERAAPPKKKKKKVTAKLAAKQPTSKSSKASAQTLSVFFSKSQSKNNVIDGTAWSESEISDDGKVNDKKSKAWYELEPLLDEEVSDEEYRPSKPKTSTAACSNEQQGKNSKTNKAKKPSKSKAKKPDNKSRPSSAVQSPQPAQPGVVSDTLARFRNARDTVMHSTVWRNVCFDTAPTNLLPLDATVALPFYSEYDQPLLTYDVDGDLRSKCKLLPQFGKSAQFISAALVADEPELTATQEDMDTRVTDVIQRELPRLRACHQRKTTALLTESRSKVRAYLAAQETLQKQRLASHPESKRLGAVDVLDKSLLNQMKQEKLTQQLSLGYANIWGETLGVEEKLYPQDVNQLPIIRPLSRCTAYIGIQANVRVEDDPILRYKPYFGEDDDGADIDEAWYDAVAPKNSSLSTGLDGEVNEFMLRLVVRECGPTENVFNALKKLSGFAQAYSDYAEIKKLDDSTRLAARRIKEAKDLIASKPAEFPLTKVAVLEPALGRSGESQQTLEERLAPPLTYFDSNLARNHANRSYGMGLRSTGEYSELLVTYRDMFCRMCYDYHCLEHGIEHPLPAHRVDPVNPPLHLSAVALAATRKKELEDNVEKEQGESVDPSSHSPDSCASTVSPPPSADANCSAEDNVKSDDTHDDVQTDEDVAMENGTTYETATDEDVALTGDSLETRRSTRAATRNSTLASRSLTKQAARPSKRKQSRPQRVQIYPEVADASEYLDDSHYAQVTAIVKKSLKDDEKCSSECWKAEQLSLVSDDLKTAANALSDTELVLLRKLRTIIGDNPCIIASMVKSTTCKEVGAFLGSERQSKPIRTSSMDDMPLSPDGRSIHNGRKRGRARNSRSSNNRILLNRTRNNRLKDKGANHEYEPCNHEGACDSNDCSCMTRDHTCDKACSCSRDCPNRFPGCKCSLGNCRTKACPCFIAARECNPDLCTTCGASEVPALGFDEERRNMSALDLGICCNVNILRGQHKKIGVAYSTTHGWGAFAMEPIKRGEFIYEYHGSLLSQDEAERRGSIYDKMTISFLFDVDDDSVVDAIRKGNKSKFANHSAVYKKCKGKVLTVNGEHRISIWAQQDISKGEELFFDYGYHGETAPDWSQLRIKGAARHGSSKKTEVKDKKKEN